MPNLSKAHVDGNEKWSLTGAVVAALVLGILALPYAIS